jgi:hypothetical protein
MLWTLYFIQSQGYGAECVGLYQDNISAQLLMKSECFLSGKKTKHMQAKLFFIKDEVDDREIQIINCPAENMWADVLTKPLQGVVFKRIRATLMNCSVEYEESKDAEKPLHIKSLPERGKIPFQTPQESGVC